MLGRFSGELTSTSLLQMRPDNIARFCSSQSLVTSVMRHMVDIQAFNSITTLLTDPLKTLCNQNIDSSLLSEKVELLSQEALLKGRSRFLYIQGNIRC